MRSSPNTPETSARPFYFHLIQIARQSNLLDECACLISKDDANFLVLLVKFRGESRVLELDAFLKSRLTEHFLPNVIVPIDTSIPLNTNGKIDRAKLYSVYLTAAQGDPRRDLMSVWQVRGKVRPSSFLGLSSASSETSEQVADERRKLHCRWWKFSAGVDIDRANQSGLPFDRRQSLV